MVAEFLSSFCWVLAIARLVDSRNRPSARPAAASSSPIPASCTDRLLTSPPKTRALTFCRNPMAFSSNRHVEDFAEVAVSQIDRVVLRWLRHERGGEFDRDWRGGG